MNWFLNRALKKHPDVLILGLALIHLLKRGTREAG